MWSSDGRPHMGHGITNLQIHTGQYLPPFLSSPFTFETCEVCCLVGIMYVQLSLSLSLFLHFFPLSSSLHVTLYPKSSFSQPQKTPSNSLFSNAQQAPPPQNPFLGVYNHFPVPLHPNFIWISKMQTQSFKLLLWTFLTFASLHQGLHSMASLCYNYGKLPSFSSFSDRLGHIKSKGICVMSLVRRVFFFLCVSTRRAS